MLHRSPGQATTRWSLAFALALRDFQPDIVLSDSSLSDFNAPAALAVLRALRPGTPPLVVFRAIDERTAVESLCAGAEDYVVKDHLEIRGVVGLVRYAMRVGLVTPDE